MRRYRCLSMNRHDLSELYTYLELFMDTYTDCPGECSALQARIKEIYLEQYPCTDVESAVHELGNPRGAGRKACYGNDVRVRIRELSAQGKTVREISRLTGVPKSTVQRLKSV